MSHAPRSVRITGWGATRRDGAHQRRPRAARRHLRRVDRQPHRHPRAARRGAARDDRHAGRHRRQARHRGRRPRSPTTSTSSSSPRSRPTTWMPATAVLVKEAIGNTRAAAFDVVAACSGSSTATPRPTPTSASGMYKQRAGHRRRAADPLPRLHRPQHLHPVRRRRRRRRAVRLRRGGRRHGRPGADHRPGRRLHDLAPVGRLASARRPPETLARGEHYVRMEGRETYRYATKTLASIGAEGHRAGRLDSPTRSTSSSPTRPTCASSSRWPRAWACPWSKMFVNVDRYGNTSAASVPIALAEAVDCGPRQGRRQDRASWPSAPASPAARPRSTWTADPAHCRRADASCRCRRPRAARLGLRRPDAAAAGGGPRARGPPVPLDDVVPGEHEPADKEVPA